MSLITEIVTFKSAEGIAKDDFIQIVDDLERNFHSLQPGFLDTELLYDENASEWIMLQHWGSMENMKAASARIFKDEASQEFVKSLISASVKMRILPQIKTWKK